MQTNLTSIYKTLYILRFRVIYIYSKLVSFLFCVHQLILKARRIMEKLYKDCNTSTSNLSI